MTADARMIFVDSSGTAARSARADKGPLMMWLRHRPHGASEASMRTVDVGAVVLSTVTIVSHHEAMLTTAAARAASTELEMLRFCDAVDALLTTSKPLEYYTAWLIVETADID